MGKILVTGGSGFIGQNLIKKLIKLKHEVITTSVLGEHIVEDVKKVLYLDLDRIEAYDISSCDTIIHLAANNDTRSIDEFAMAKANFHDPIKLFETSSVRKFIFASSTAVYGNSIAPYIENSTPLNPLNVYAKSKLLFEKWAMRQNLKSTNFVGLRFCNVYGPGEDHKGKRMSMIGQMLNKALRNETIELFTDGNQKRDWVYVDDVADCIIKAMTVTKNEIYNVGSGKSLSFNDLAACIKKIIPETTVKMIDHPFPEEYQNHTECNIEKAGLELGFNPQYNVERGIQEYVTYLKEKLS